MKIIEKSTFKVLYFEKENDDFSDITIKTVNVFEYNI